MTAHANLDRESFQALLASAFAVQESGMNKQALSALIELHKAVANDELPFEKILDLIADRARIVADATGIAIGLLSGNRLVYRAGSGRGAQYIGQHVTAVLSASARTGPRKEILRVDNAESDPRIEAAICRECEAKAMLIMPIHRDRFVAGVLEVMFSDTHTFDDREMRTYRMMVKLAEEAMARDLQLSQTGAQAIQPTTRQPSVGTTPSQMQGFGSDVEPTFNSSVTQVCGAPATVPGTIPLPHAPSEEVTTIKWPLKRAFFCDPRWSLGGAAIVILLAAVGWISVHPHTAFTMEGGARIVRSDTSEKHAPKPTANNGLNEASGKQYTNAARLRFKRVRVGPNEVDYIADDVTIRYFTKPVPPSRTPAISKQLDIADDVTVRVFNHKPEVVPENSRRQEGRNP